uniref:LPXTG cell wall anchor domain-containing protein n=1 Tax=Lactobacillus kefiranofaciens TaxID=267818 RepID=UPI0034E8D396
MPFYRTGTKDEVTGEVKFDQPTWKPVDQNNSKFKQTTLPAKDGYDVVVTVNGKETKLIPDKNGKYEINNSALDQFGRPANVEVKYVASGSEPVAPDDPDAPNPGVPQDEVRHLINFVDSNNQVVGSQTVSGEDGKTISVKLNVPEHWQVAKNGATTTSITLDQAKNDPTTITIEHKIDQITNAEQAKQSGNDLFYKEVKRTFIINDPTTATRSMFTTFAAVPNADDNVQIVSFYRTGSYDEVTKKAKFTADWKPGDGKTASFAPKIIKGKAGYNAYLVIDKDHKVQLRANANGDYEFPSEAATQDANYVIDFEKIPDSNSDQHNQNSGSTGTGTTTTPSGSGAADSASTNNQSNSQNNIQDQTANSPTTNDESSSSAASADSSNADNNDYDDADYDDSDDDYDDSDNASTTTAARKTAYSNNNVPRSQNSQNRGTNGIVHAAEVNASAVSGSSMTSNASRAALPKTGENSDSLAVLGAGALAISLIGLAGVKKRRED